MSSSAIPEKKPKGRLFTLTAIAAFVVLVVWFALQNAESVTFQFATWSWDISLALLLFTCVFLGVLLACLAVLPSLWSERRYRKKLEKQNTALADANETLRIEKGRLESKVSSLKNPKTTDGAAAK